MSSFLIIKESLHAKAIKNKPAMSMLSNNETELIGRMQKGGLMAEEKVELTKNSTSTGADPTGLGRWTYFDAVNVKKICELSLHINVSDLIQQLAHCIVNDEDYF